MIKSELSLNLSTSRIRAVVKSWTYDTMKRRKNVMSLVVELRKNLGCNSPIEITYYNSGNENICFHCGTLEELQLKDDQFPICEVCIAANKKQIRCQARSTYKPKDK